MANARMNACAVCSGTSQANRNALHTCRSFLSTLPFDALLEMLGRVPPIDIARVADALPFAAGTDRHLWHTFYVRSFGGAVPRRIFLARGYLDWSRMYHDEQVRARHLRLRFIETTNMRSTATPPPRITVTTVGNVHRIRSTTSDENSAPVVIRGNLARFDWTKRR